MIIYPILFSFLAGLGTALGALISFLFKPTKILMAVSIGFAAGVMLTLAFTGLLQEALAIKYTSAIIGFALGALFILILDSFLPHIAFSILERGAIEKKVLKTITLIAIGVTLHNIPEGFAVSAGYYHLPALGLFVALAMALHNIPEGMAISLPIISTGGSKKQAFIISLFSGLAEPLGAIVGVLLLSLISKLIPLVLAFAAGIMVYLVIDELLPLAQRYRHPHGMGFGVIAGCVVAMLISTII